RPDDPRTYRVYNPTRDDDVSTDPETDRLRLRLLGDGEPFDSNLYVALYVLKAALGPDQTGRWWRHQVSTKVTYLRNHRRHPHHPALAEQLGRELEAALDAAQSIDDGLPPEWSAGGVKNLKHAQALVRAARDVAVAWRPWLRLFDPKGWEELQKKLEVLAPDVTYSEAAFTAAELGYRAIREDGDAEVKALYDRAVEHYGRHPPDPGVMKNSFKSVWRHLFSDKHVFP